MNDECCGSCRFWKASPHDKLGERGECRRLPPTITHALVLDYVKNDFGNLAGSVDLWSAYAGSFPLTYRDDWCGEWLRLKEKPAPRSGEGRP